MIRDRIFSPHIHAVRYDSGTQTMIVEFTDGSLKYHAPVPVDTYQSVVHSRFPEKTYHHYLRAHVLA
jgi:hypothetical protein